MKTTTTKPEAGTFTLSRILPDGDDKPWNDLTQMVIFRVSGPQTTVTHYEDGGLTHERKMSRGDARRLWRSLLEDGYSSTGAR